MRTLVAQRWLTGLWSLLTLLATSLLLYYTANRSLTDEAALWQWYCPYVFPGLLLMVGTLVSAEKNKKKTTAVSSRFLFWICAILSVLYGLWLLYSLRMGMYRADAGGPSLEDTLTLLDYLKANSFQLTALQSITTAALGGFFMADKK